MHVRPGGGPAGDTATTLDGRYRLGPVLAHGGMSTVYRGTDTRLDRPVAVKVMDPRLAGDPAFRTRFEREARSAARIHHPAVVGVHDQGMATGPGEPLVFLVMELVEGGTVRDVLAARGALDVPTALAVLDPMLDGLAEAHRRGLVHRDVKPENVLISRAGQVKVGDFGLVTAAAQAGASHAGMILGTVAYLSPEQVDTGAADARSDVYAAGVVAFELLTGTVPFTGDSPIAVAYRHVHDDVPAPSTLVAGVPPELDDLVVRATRRDPAARPADAAAFRAALLRVADRAGIRRVPPPVPPARPDAAEVRTHTAAVGGPTAVPGPRGTRVYGRDTTWGGPPAPGGAVTPDPYDPVRSRRRGRRLFGAAFAVVAVLGVLVGASGWLLADGRWTTIPKVVGLEQAAAMRMIADADLVADVSVAHDDAVAAGRVAAVDPGPDERLLRGSTVALTVSSGRPVVPVVAAGSPVDAAERTLREAGFTPTRAGPEYSASVASGAVVRTDPPAGTALASGSAVALVASRGPEPRRQVRVPFLIGRTAAQATSALEALGLSVEVENGFPFGGRPADEAQVVRQSHGAGSLVDRGTTVTLRTL